MRAWRNDSNVFSSNFGGQFAAVSASFIFLGSTTVLSHTLGGSLPLNRCSNSQLNLWKADRSRGLFIRKELFLVSSPSRICNKTSSQVLVSVPPTSTYRISLLSRAHASMHHLTNQYLPASCSPRTIIKSLFAVSGGSG